jgi:hypothetical protein
MATVKLTKVGRVQIKVGSPLQFVPAGSVTCVRVWPKWGTTGSVGKKISVYDLGQIWHKPIKFKILDVLYFKK